MVLTSATTPLTAAYHPTTIMALVTREETFAEIERLRYL